MGTILYPVPVPVGTILHPMGTILRPLFLQDVFRFLQCFSLTVFLQGGDMYGQTVWCCAYRLASATVVFHSIGLAPATGLILVVLDLVRLVETTLIPV